MRWVKKGHIFTPSHEFGWMNSHAQVPTVLNLGEKLVVYFSTRTIKSESKIACLELDAKIPKNILNIFSQPVIKQGQPGCFDEHGTMPSCIFEKNNGEKLLYYSGWSRRTSVPYSNLAGVCFSQDGYKFHRKFDGPVLSTNPMEPFSATSPFVYYIDGTYFCYYCSGTYWHKINKKFEHTYDIKLATSKDGINWYQSNRSAVPSSNPFEAITRPSIIKLNGSHHMWFCYRGSKNFRNGKESYRIGYAVSEDLYNWVRYDHKCGIDTSESGWDSYMLAYPYVIKTDYGIYMFYNGNGFGETGFGYAVLEI